MAGDRINASRRPRHDFASEDFDWGSFDEEHPAFNRIRGHLHRHSDRERPRHKNWLIPQWIGQDDLIVVFGASEAGKSVFAVDTACRLAAGWDFEGREIFARQNVLYIAAERPKQVERRVDAFCQHHDGERFDNLVVYDGPVDLTVPGGLRAIIRVAEDNMGEVDVVIVDTLAAAMTGSDSNPDAMARAVGNLNDAVRFGNRETGCTVIVVHHTPVSGEARLRGGGQLQGAADTTIHITRKAGFSTAKVVKNNENPERPERAFGMHTVSLGRDFDDQPETTAAVLIPRPIAVEREPRQRKPAGSRAVRDAEATLRAAIAANDNKPANLDQWRAASYGMAGDISDAGKRMAFSRQRKSLEGIAVEQDGLFDLPAPQQTA